MTYNIIADIAGRFDELLLLLAKMPKADKIILVGDMIDRGPKSKEVLEWAMSGPDVIALKGNHEHMMVDCYLNTGIYAPRIWEENGGYTTQESYDNYVPESHIYWMRDLPIFFEDEGLFVSHAPWNGSFKLGKYKSEEDILWNRYQPKKHKGVFQVHGHNSSLKVYGDYAICIDNCSQKVLTGLHWFTKQIFE